MADPTPYTLHRWRPYTLHPTPYTLHPTPYTLNNSSDRLYGRNRHFTKILPVKLLLLDR